MIVYNYVWDEGAKGWVKAPSAGGGGGSGAYGGPSASAIGAAVGAAVPSAADIGTAVGSVVPSAAAIGAAVAAPSAADIGTAVGAAVPSAAAIGAAVAAPSAADIGTAVGAAVPSAAAISDAIKTGNPVPTSHGVTLAGHGSRANVTAGTALPLVAASTPAKWVTVQAGLSNTGVIAVGGSGVNASTTGVALQAGASVTLPCSNLNAVFFDSTVAGGSVRFTYYV